MKIFDLKHSQTAWKEEIVNHYRFLPYWWVRQVDQVSLQRLMRHHLEQMIAEETAVILGADQQSTLTGFASMHPLQWDSEHFGFRVWRLPHVGVWGTEQQQQETAHAITEAIVKTAVQQEVQTIHLWQPLDAMHVVHALENAGFCTMESQVYWLFNLKRQSLPAQQTSAKFRPHRPEDEAELVTLASRVYAPIPNRFYADPHLPTDACDALYEKWLRNACKGEAADYISVIDVDGKVAGYGTLRFLDDQNGLCNVRMGQFLLGAIDPAFRQRGLYDDMMRSLLVWLLEQKADIAFVGTQTNNAAAQAGMVRMGFRPVTSGLSLHLWVE